MAAATALWVARPLFPSEAAAVQGDGLPAVMLWMVLLAIWALSATRQPRFRLRFSATDLAVLALVAWLTFSAIWWAGRASPRPTVNMLWEWVGFVASYVLARQLLAGPRESRAMISVMCSLAVALAAFGLHQYCFEMPATRAAYAADPDKALAEAGLDLPPGSAERFMYEKRLASVEPIATFALTNSLAGLLAPWLVVLVGVIVVDRVPRDVSMRELLGPLFGKRPPRPRLPLRVVDAFEGMLAKRLCLAGMISSAIVVAGCLLLTKSRSAYVAVAAGLVLLGWMWRGRGFHASRKWIVIAAVLAVLLAIAAYAIGGLDREVLTEAAKSLGYRWQYWQGSLAMIADHPLVGCGPGNFQDAYKRHKLPEASEEIADPHNVLLEVWATAGTPAMLALVVTLAAFSITVFRQLNRNCESATAPPCSTDNERAVFVHAGAAAGFVLVIPLSAISPAPPERILYAVALPSAFVAIWSTGNWVVRGRLFIGLPIVGVAVLLVHLLASGGIGFAGVAGSLWLLVAMGLNAAEDWKHRDCPRWVGWAVVAAAFAAAIACYLSGYRPVLQSKAALARAQREPAVAERYLLEAAHADPLAIEPWNQLAALAFRDWRAHPQSEEALDRFASYTRELIARAPRASAIWETAGERYFQMFEIAGGASCLEQAESCLRTAVALYPNNATLRAKWALTLRAAGNQQDYERVRQQAWKLDQLTPHLDKKLPAELRDALNRR